MSKYLDHEPELQLMEVSQDPTSMAYQQNKRFQFGVVPHSADDWNSTGDESISYDDFVDIDNVIDTDLDNDIVNFDIDEF